MMRLTTAIAALCMTLSGADHAQAAIAANLLPRAEYIEEIVGFPNDPHPPGRLYEAESFSYANTHVSANHSATIEAHAENRSIIAGSPILTIDGRATNTGTIEPGYEGVRARVEANYYFEVRSGLGDRTVPIILPIEWSASLSRQDEGSAFVQWTVSITPQLNAFRGSASTSRTYTVNESFHNTTAGETSRTQLALEVYTSEFDYYKVHIELSGSAGRLGSIFNPNPASGHATFMAVIDPLPMVDPTFINAAGTTFLFSENLFATSVPEPAVGWLWVAGLGWLVWTTLRTRSRRSSSS